MKELKTKLLGLGVFVDNEYLDLYCTLVFDNQERTKETGRTQRHHIIPRAYYKSVKLPVDNTKTNMVNLLSKDHVLAHYYLALCAKEALFRTWMVCGISRMLSGGKGIGYISEYADMEAFLESLDQLQTLYEEAAITRAAHTAEAIRGKPRPEDVRQKISQSTNKLLI